MVFHLKDHFAKLLDGKAISVDSMAGRKIFGKGDKNMRDQKMALKELQQIPGVGKAVARDLWNLGIRSIKDLKDQDPQALYEQLCAQQGCHVDRCMLYVFRCAVYYASHDEYEAELLKWWNWKERC